MAKNKNSLNKKEKQEIVLDVKKALEEAKNNFKNHDRKTPKKVIILSTIIILIISLGAIYWYFASNPRVLFGRSMNSFWNDLNKDFALSDNLTESVDISCDVKTGNKELNKYNYKIDYLTGNNYLWKTYSGDNLLSEITFYNNDKSYIYVSDLNDKYISLNDDYFNYNYKDFKVLSESLNAAFLKSINNYKISNTKAVLKIDGMLVNTSKMTVNLNNTNLDEVIDNINNYLKNDTSFQNSYRLLFKNKSFETVTNNLKNNLQNSKVKINIYTKGFNHSFVSLEITEFKNNITNIFKVTKMNNNKYYIVLDNKGNLTKDEYMIAAKKNKSSFIYDINIKQKQNENIVSDMDISIKPDKASEANISSNIDTYVDYKKLSNGEKNKLDEKLKPIKMFNDELFKK